MENNILLIYPPSPVMNREDRCQQPTDDLIVIPPLPPLDLMYMASVARGESYIPHIRDYSLSKDGKNELIDDIKKINPKYVVVNVASTTLKNDLSAIKLIKSINKSIITIVKGAHFLIKDKDTLKEFEDIDIAIRGEVEFTLKEILQNKSLDEILGITYRCNDNIIRNEKRPFIENLDEIPYPARDLIDNSKYIRPDTGEIQGVIKVSRGCPYHCFFCLATPVSGSKVRMRSPKNIIGEIKECYEKYGIKNFVFWSDIFNIDNSWVKDLCNEIANSGLKITFSTNTRADSADFETAKLMKKAGCSLVSIGIESGVQEILDKIGKKITTEQIKSTVKMFKKLGIKIYAYYVIGLPWESMETFKKTLNFAKSLNTEYVSFYTAAALVGTRFYDFVCENNLGELNYDMPYYYPSVNTFYLSKDEVFKLHKKAVKEYYARLSYIIMMLFKIRSLKEFINYAKAGLRVVFRK